ncbi:MAG: ribosome silencing factor [Candidatus Omnitrophica bacterium]|nr:ribosome silencing factor [Candidatus Omnitrophota bacterium]
MIPNDLVSKIAQFASDKKAENIAILEMKEIVNFCDYFVICTGNTDRHVKAIADNIQDELAKTGMKISSKQRTGKNDWVVFDIGDVVVHVFEKDTREFYQLEYLWRDAKKIDWVEEIPQRKVN